MCARCVHAMSTPIYIRMSDGVYVYTHMCARCVRAMSTPVCTQVDVQKHMDIYIYINIHVSKVFKVFRFF